MKAEERAERLAAVWGDLETLDGFRHDVTQAIRQAEAAARAEERAECAKIADRNGNAITAGQIRARD